MGRSLAQCLVFRMLRMAFILADNTVTPARRIQEKSYPVPQDIYRTD